MPVPLIVAAWVVLGLAVSGVGLLAGRVLGKSSGGNVSRTFWLGIAATLAALNGWCLILPVNGWASAVFLCAAGIGFAVAGEDRKRWIARIRGERACVIALLAVSIPLAWLATSGPRNGDSYLYHLHAIAWAESFAAVPGLGNLHGRLAFNNASTLLFALFDHGPLAGKVCHVANGLFLLPILGRGIRGIARLAAGKKASARDALDAILLAGAVDWALGPNVTSASPDLLVACLEAAIASEVVGAVAAGALISPAIVVMGAALLTVKLSAFGFVAGLFVVLIVRKQRPLEWRRALALAAFAILAWVVRGVVLSGYPLYPSDLGGFPVDWRIPLDRVQEEAGYALGWGRRAGVPWRQVLASSDWIGPWARSMALLNREIVVPLSSATVLLIAVTFRKRLSTISWFAIFAPPVLELIWWFATSPDPRFAGACFWLLPGGAAAMLLIQRTDRGATAALAVVSLLLAGWPILTAWGLGGLVLNAPVESRGTTTRPFVTTSGFVVAIPDTGSNCTGEPLVCTPFPDARLSERSAGDPSHGFRISSPGQ